MRRRLVPSPLALAIALGLAATVSAMADAMRCSHPYAPIGPTVKREYRSTDESGFGDYTEVYGDFAGDSFTHIVLGANGRVGMRLRCDSKNEIVPDKTVPGDNAMMTLASELNSGAATLPPVADWQPGKSWSVARAIDAITNGVAVVGTLNAAFDMIGTEQVSVPAGDYTAMKVTRRIDLKVTATVEDVPTPINETIVSTVWYAKGVGIVKIETKEPPLTLELYDHRR